MQLVKAMLTSVFGVFFLALTQSSEPLYLVFDKNRDSKSESKLLGNNKSVFEYLISAENSDSSMVEKFHFDRSTSVDTVAKSDLISSRIVNIETARKMELNFRKGLIKEDSARNTLRLPPTINDVFKTIYILEPIEGNLFLRYKVWWVDKDY